MLGRVGVIVRGQARDLVLLWSRHSQYCSSIFLPDASHISANVIAWRNNRISFNLLSSELRYPACAKISIRKESFCRNKGKVWGCAIWKWCFWLNIHISFIQDMVTWFWCMVFAVFIPSFVPISRRNCCKDPDASWPVIDSALHSVAKVMSCIIPCVSNGWYIPSPWYLIGPYSITLGKCLLVWRAWRRLLMTGAIMLSHSERVNPDTGRRYSSFFHIMVFIAWWASCFVSFNSLSLSDRILSFSMSLSYWIFQDPSAETKTPRVSTAWDASIRVISSRSWEE